MTEGMNLMAIIKVKISEARDDRNDPWEIDHDVPVARGGTDHLSNLRLCHRSCNRDKAAS